MKKIILGLSVLAFLASCNNDDDNNDVVTPRGDYEEGVIVLNEGGFGNGNASVSFIKDDAITNDVYATVNSTTLGDTAQSITFDDDLAFIVLNGSNKVEVVNRYTFESVATITDNMSNPRYVAFTDDYAYVTNWGDASSATDDYVAVVRLSDYSVTSTIAVGQGPETILEEDGKLYVAHKGGYSQENFVSVIDESTNTVDTTIEVAYMPNSMVINSGSLFVLCGGKPSWTGDETVGGIYMINLASNTATSVYSFDSGVHPSHLVENSGTFYYTASNSVYTYDITNHTVTDFASDATTLYGMNVHDGKIYVGDAVDYSSNGTVYVYDLEGTLEAQYTTGVLPNSFYFND